VGWIGVLRSDVEEWATAVARLASGVRNQIEDRDDLVAWRALFQLGDGARTSRLCSWMYARTSPSLTGK
jgi:hypothetical protein